VFPVLPNSGISGPGSIVRSGVGQLEDVQGSYSAGLLVCLSMEAVAAIIVISPILLRRSKAVAPR
jgi:hypothetical protein